MRDTIPWDWGSCLTEETRLDEAAWGVGIWMGLDLGVIETIKY